MRRKTPRHIEDEELDPYATERVNAVSDLFPDERLKESFGLTKRECCFVRAYAVLLNAQRSAIIAGYTERYARTAYLLLRKESIANALDAMMEEAVNPVRERQTVANVNTAVSRLMDIIRSGDDKAAVMASKTLLEYIGGDVIRMRSEDDQKKDDVPDSEISASLKRMGVIADG